MSIFQKAVLAAGRDIEEIDLIAVSKRKPIEAIDQVYKAGQLLFGENQIQEIESKWPDFKKENSNRYAWFIYKIRYTTT